MTDPAPATALARSARRRVRLAVRVALIAAVCGVVAWQVVASVRLRAQLGRATSALDRDDPEEARRQLDRYLESRPDSAEAHFRAAQAARRSGDLPAALGHLKEAERLRWPPADLRLEHALISVQTGRVAEGEPVLLQALAENHEQTPHILPVLVPVYVAQYRLPEAAGLSARWVELRPESAKAWRAHAEILERLRKKQEAVEALRRVVTLDTDDAKARLSLARLLLEIRQSVDEAATHLEWICRAEPGNAVYQTDLAICRAAQGRADEAAKILDDVLAGPGADARAFQHRGRIEVDRGRPGDGVRFLRRSVELDPSDPEGWYALFQCLGRAGLPDEARAAEERWKRAEADLKRVAELTRAIAASPYNPELRREAGELFLRNGREADGLRWLESALAVDPEHAPTHRVLADHYDRKGKPDLAARHRAIANAAPPVKKP